MILSPDAEEPLLSLDLAKVYCIGGIVDRTVKKGTTLAHAVRESGQGGQLDTIHRGFGHRTHFSVMGGHS